MPSDAPQRPEESWSAFAGPRTARASIALGAELLVEQKQTDPSVSETRSHCAHCGASVTGAEPASSAPVFCCQGCATVYALLSHYQLDAYYDYQDAQGRRPVAASSKDTFSEFDDVDFIQEHTRELGDQRELEFYLEGVHCGACVWLVEKLPRVVSGVCESRLSLGDNTVRVRFDPGAASPSSIARGLASLGYHPHARAASTQRDLRAREDRELLLQMGVAGAAAGNVMLLAFALYSGASGGMTEGVRTMLRAYSALIAIPAVLWSARPFFRGAWAALRTRTPHMDLPIAIGILAGLLWGIASALTNTGDIYFDSVCTLVFLLLVGRLIQVRQARKAQGQAEFLYALAPATAELVTETGVQQVRAEAVPRGATVRVRAGQRVPVDGVITVGQSSLDLALLSGESRPRRVFAGDRVHAGTVNIESPIDVRAEASGHKTRVAELLSSIDTIRAERSPIRILADRLSGTFVVVASALALVAFAVGAQFGVAIGIERAVALLVVTCPCALGLATSLGATVAMGRAARRGLLIKGGSYVEALAKPGLIIFDKTGTLTQGKLRLTRWFATGVIEDETLRALVLALEGGSSHPIARALERELGAEPNVAALAQRFSLSDCREQMGRGISGKVQGYCVSVGSPAQAVASLGALSAAVVSQIQQIAAQAETPVLVCVDGAVAAVLGLGDPLRPEAGEVLRQLSRLGYQLAVASGDEAAVVARVAEATGASFSWVRGGMSPEQKLEAVRQAAAHGQVFMIGDGVNDSAALAAATVGVAVHGGAEASLAVADVFATESGLAVIGELVVGSRRTLALIHKNFAFSLAYNVIAASLAIFGYITPLVAAVLMPLSSLVIVASSFHATTFGEKT